MDWIRENIPAAGFEQVVFGEHRPSGLRSIIAIHSTSLGPACGGLRMLPYGSKDEALYDVLRLARGMSYKSALAGIGFGGGKSVIWGDPASKTPAMLQAFGSFVDTLGGKYIAAKDMNIDTKDLAEVRKTTKHVLGVDGEPGSSGDPSPLTAVGVYRAMEATVEEMTGKRDLKGISVAIQGIGHVGYDLAERLRRAGASLWVTDTDKAAVEKAKKNLGARSVHLEEIYDVDCDIYSPCARGATLNPKTIPRLRCKAVVGCANNQLENDSDGYQLIERGILYAPDFVVNSGGIINVFGEYAHLDIKKVTQMAEAVYDATREILKRSQSTGRPAFVIAEELAKERIKNPRVA